jgi:NAD(P) transhydrogenase
MQPHAFDLVVVGSGPAGQKGAIAAAKLGKRVAVIDRKQMVGGVCLHTGTIPSKTLREAILYLSGYARGRLRVDEGFRTSVPHISAAGDVIGFPSLASSSMEQGRLASGHMFGVSANGRNPVLPCGIYTIPEISMVGKTEEQLTADRIPYEVGLSKFAELAKGQMLGDEVGMLKILFDPKSLRLLGVHAIGERAAEIIHIGQAVLALGATIEYFRDTTFNHPTLAEAYKVAGLDGLNRL